MARIKGKQSEPIIIKDDIVIITVKSKKYGFKEIIIDKDDYEKVSKFTWGIKLDKPTGKFYSQSHDYDDKTIKLHRYITECPDVLVVDHVNGNTLDNRKCNLRICTRGENNRNIPKRKDATHSKYKGVKRHPKDNKFHAWITHNKKRIYLGGYNTEKEAGLAYNEASKKYHGEYGCLNIID